MIWGVIIFVEKSVFLQTLYVFTFVSRRGQNLGMHGEKKVDIEGFIEFRRNRSDFVQNQCFHAPKHDIYIWAAVRCGMPPTSSKTAISLPRGDLTLYVDLPRSCSADPTGRGRSGTTRKQRHHSVVQGVPCHPRAQGSSVNPFGYPPLSDNVFPPPPRIYYTPNMSLIYL